MRTHREVGNIHKWTKFGNDLFFFLARGAAAAAGNCRWQFLKPAAKRAVTPKPSRWQESCTNVAKAGPAQNAGVKLHSRSGED